MLKKTMMSVLIVAAFATPLSLTAGAASAQDYYGGWHDRGGWDRGGWNDRRDWSGQYDRSEWRHHRHHDYGGVVAGGLAAGLVGGLITGAIVNGNTGYYVPAPRCWNQRQAVQDRYDDGYHYETVRVCN